MSSDVIVHHTQNMEWDSGGAVLDLMAPEFRDHLGPSDDHYLKYHQIQLWTDPETGRRTDLLRMDPGYLDASMAYHDCVEECFALAGECDLWGEGKLLTGEYFWRPPGWIHSAGSTTGFTALLILEGNRTEDGSGPVSRVIRPDDEGGQNGIHPEGGEVAMGPRGFVKRSDSAMLPWISGPAFARTEGTLDGFDVEHTRFKVLSKNHETGAQTILIQLLPGYRQAFEGALATRVQLFVIEGSAQLGATALGTGSYVNAAGGAPLGLVSSEAGATFFAKVDGWLDFQPVVAAQAS